MGMKRIVLVMVFAGCGALRSADDAGADGGVDASCCRIADGVMDLSWDCYCARFDCTRQPAAECAPDTVTTLGCGLRTDGQYTAFGGHTYVFGDAGVLVGADMWTDTALFACVAGSRESAYRVRAGVFMEPDAGCATTCDCVDGGVACP